MNERQLIAAIEQATQKLIKEGATANEIKTLISVKAPTIGKEITFYVRLSE